ncbi:hypothetical protein OR1_02039 [Geobacter sp. OR-1]|uniref:outer membrane protein n=1 Tax=Geobacter sp. OR-1 TaxID=1266765 RepID=UPI000542C5D4|nr:outer membrane beta-barrel protein [Geobacter sp. OR-1]GAM09758.1 hypothetical protein OR1_02039 [Geobacter sp. OR-1]
MGHLIFFVVTALLLALPGMGSNAAAADYDWMRKKDQVETSGKKYVNQYALFRAGGFFPEGSPGMNIGEGAEAGYGIQPIRWLAAEASFGFIAADDYDDNLKNLHRSLQLVPVTGTIRAIYPFKQFDIYALAGGGMYYSMLKVENRNQVTASIEDDKVLFGYHYGGGVSMLLGGSSSLGIEVKRFETRWDDHDLDIRGTFLTAFFRLGL